MRYGSMREGDFGLLFRGSFPISTVLFFPKVFILSNPKVLGAFEVTQVRKSKVADMPLSSIIAHVHSANQLVGIYAPIPTFVTI